MLINAEDSVKQTLAIVHKNLARRPNYSLWNGNSAVYLTCMAWLIVE